MMNSFRKKEYRALIAEALFGDKTLDVLFDRIESYWSEEKRKWYIMALDEAYQRGHDAEDVRDYKERITELRETNVEDFYTQPEDLE